VIAGRVVTLLDGRQVDSASEEWRHETEARAIAALRTTADRRIWLEDIERRRGKAAADQLRATVGALWKAKQR
jgi:hypothetical protein